MAKKLTGKAKRALENLDALMLPYQAAWVREARAGHVGRVAPAALAGEVFAELPGRFAQQRRGILFPAEKRILRELRPEAEPGDSFVRGRHRDLADGRFELQGDGHKCSSV